MGKAGKMIRLFDGVRLQGLYQDFDARRGKDAAGEAARAFCPLPGPKARKRAGGAGPPPADRPFVAVKPPPEAMAAPASPPEDSGGQGRHVKS